MILTTTHSVEGKRITEYKGVVTGETIFGANIVKDFLAGIRDILGGRSKTYEKTIDDARETSLKEITAEAEAKGANAIVGVTINYHTIGDMIMVTVTGTAVTLS